MPIRNFNNFDLFNQSDASSPSQSYQKITEGAFHLSNFISDHALLFKLSHEIQAVSPFRYMHTPSGLKMSIAMTSCGEFGWVSDKQGYRYERLDPLTKAAWPSMPTALFDLAQQAAALVGFEQFAPDSCLINKYEIGAKLSLHQDLDEKDFTAPIVSVSLGLPAIFQFGGLKRNDAIQKIFLSSGEVVVWGGPARLNFHGILPLKKGYHALFGPYRFNLTFRKAK